MGEEEHVQALKEAAEKSEKKLKSNEEDYEEKMGELQVAHAESLERLNHKIEEQKTSSESENEAAKREISMLGKKAAEARSALVMLKETASKARKLYTGECEAVRKHFSEGISAAQAHYTKSLEDLKGEAAETRKHYSGIQDKIMEESANMKKHFSAEVSL